MKGRHVTPEERNASLIRKVSTPGGLEEMVGDLLDAVGDDSDKRKRAIVKMAREAAAGLPDRCEVEARVNGKRVRCSLRIENGVHGDLPCDFHLHDPTLASAPKDAEEDLDALLEWSPEPGPLLDEILSLLGNLPPVTEVDRIAELAGKLAGMVR